MIAEIGHFALVLALALALVQSVVPLVGARKRDGRLMSVAGSTALAQFGFVVIAFVSLMACYVQSDFSVANVAENSHSAMPDRKSTRLNSSHIQKSRMPSSA